MKPIYLTFTNLNQHPKDSVFGKPGTGKSYNKPDTETKQKP